MTLTPADSLAGKVAIVTGARRGIGRAEAILLAERGASVVVNGLAHGGDDSVESLADEIRSNGGQAVAEVCSVASFESGEQLVDRALSEFGRIDIIVNTAGVVRMTPVELATDEDWDFMVNVNLKGTYATARAALRQFKKQGSGIIVNTSSDAGTGDFYNSIYAATKEGVLGMTRAIAREYGRYGIRCNAIRPRAFDTGMTSPQTFSRQYGFAEQFGVPACGSHRFTPRDGTAAEVAEVVAWLCTDAASHLNGQLLQVGCGRAWPLGRADGGALLLRALRALTRRCCDRGRLPVRRLQGPIRDAPARGFRGDGRTSRRGSDALGRTGLRTEVLDGTGS
ncbi:SDR family NAD(P)-dependent oxidoreductase [Aeromicrobium sp. UC242_57]|uniref:SDR family NAD(P)-dependent oxidoreductase n=1 Tax=Aeromicrobium sp. UC242_57 TaxID=3374624 RepID=UPI0037A1C128